MSIFLPTSVSYEFYRELFSQLFVNNLLADMGHCKLIADMDHAEYVSYQKHLKETVDDVQLRSSE
jgi:hypothetical protein